MKYTYFNYVLDLYTINTIEPHVWEMNINNNNKVPY